MAYLSPDCKREAACRCGIREDGSIDAPILFGGPAQRDASPLGTTQAASRLWSEGGVHYEGNGQNNTAPEMNQGAENENITTEPIHVGRATTIWNPYSGKTPTQNYVRTAPVEITQEQLTAAQNAYNQAVEGEQAGEGPVRTLLSRLYSAFKGPKAVSVKGMTYNGTTYKVDVPNNLPGKLASQHPNAEAFSILDNLSSIIQNGEYPGSGQAVTKGGQPKKNIVRYDYFESEVQIDGKPYIVKWEVENVPGGNNYKTHRLVNIKIDPASTAGPLVQTDQNPIDTGSTQGGAAAPSPMDIVPQTARAVNEESTAENDSGRASAEVADRRALEREYQERVETPEQRESREALRFLANEMTEARGERGIDVMPEEGEEAMSSANGLTEEDKPTAAP